MSYPLNEQPKKVAVGALESPRMQLMRLPTNHLVLTAIKILPRRIELRFVGWKPNVLTVRRWERFLKLKCKRTAWTTSLSGWYLSVSAAPSAIDVVTVPRLYPVVNTPLHFFFIYPSFSASTSVNPYSWAFLALPRHGPLVYNKKGSRRSLIIFTLVYLKMIRLQDSIRY